jgi:hypothetical protein
MSLGKKSQYNNLLGDYKASIYEKLRKSSNNNNSFIKRNISHDKTYNLKESVDKSLERRRIITNNFEVNTTNNNLKDSSFNISSTTTNKNFLEYMKNSGQVKLNANTVSESMI